MTVTRMTGQPTDWSPLSSKPKDDVQQPVSVDASAPLDAPSDPPSDPTTTVTTTATTMPTSDADQTVKTFSFGGQVSTMALPSLTPASTQEVQTFFGKHQDQVPTAISLSGNAAIFTFGDKHIKVAIADLNKLRQSGDIPDNSCAMEALRVAKNINAVPGLTPSQTREITRNFVRSMQPVVKGGQGFDPSKARLEAYTNVTAALRLGPDPVGQLKKDLTVVQNLSDPKTAKLTGFVMKPELKLKLETLLQARTQAVSNGNFALAADLQDELAAFAKKNGMPPMGAQVTDLPEPVADPHPLEAATFKGNSLENDLLARGRTMRKGDSIDFSNSLEGGFKMGLGVGLKLDVGGHESPSLASAEVDASVSVGGHTKGKIECDEHGDFIVDFQHFVAAGASVGASLKAIIELAGAEASGKGGCMVNFKAKCSSYREACKLLADMVDNNNSVKNVPTKSASTTGRPEAGQFIMLSQSFGLGTKTETETRRFAVTLPSEKSTVVNGQGNLVRDNLPGTASKKVKTETTRYTQSDGSKVADRAYNVIRTGGNLLLRILTLGIVGRKTINSNVELKLKEVAPPPLAKGQFGPSLPSVFEPDLSVKISSSKVRACKDVAAVEILIKKEFNQMLTVMQAANKDAGKPVFDLSEDGMMYAQESLRKGFMLIYNDANNMGIGKGTIKQDADSTRTDVGLFVLGNGASAGMLRGDMVTIKIPFDKGTDSRGAGGFKASTGNVAIGMTTTYGNYFEASLGVDTGITIPVAEVSAKVYIKGAKEQGGYSEVIGRNTIENPELREPKRQLFRSEKGDRILKDLLPESESGEDDSEDLFAETPSLTPSHPAIFIDESDKTKKALKTLLPESESGEDENDDLFGSSPSLESNPTVFTGTSKSDKLMKDLVPPESGDPLGLQKEITLKPKANVFASDVTQQALKTLLPESESGEDESDDLFAETPKLKTNPSVFGGESEGFQIEAEETVAPSGPQPLKREVVRENPLA